MKALSLLSAPVLASPLLASIVAFGVLGCAGSDSPAGVAPADSGSSDSKAGDSVSDGPSDTPVAVPCSEPEADRPAGSVCVKHVKGKISDSSGKPIPKLLITVCGQICYFGKSNDTDGTFDTEVGKYINTDKFAVIVHARVPVPGHSNLYIALPAKPDADGLITIEPVTLTTLPADGADLVKTDGETPAAASVTGGDVRLDIPTGTKVTLNIEDFDTTADGNPLGHKFRSAKVDPANYPPFAKGSGAAVWYALAPCDAVFDKKVSVTIPNPDKAAFPAGTAVTFLYLGNELLKTPFTAGQLQKDIPGKVSADGNTITSEVGQGLSVVTWLGVKKG